MKDLIEAKPFIVFEGLDGSGKSTQIELLSFWLAQQDIAYLSTREPGGTDFGEALRKILKTYDMCSISELLLFNAARYELIEQIIKPNRQSKWILCDRYIYSTWAYQHYGRGVSPNIIKSLDELHEKIMPDMVIFLPQHQRLTPRDAFESIDSALVLNGYKQMFDENWLIVPKLSIEDTCSYIIDAVSKKFASFIK